MTIHRFYVPSVSGIEHRVRLSHDEALHATRVLRLRSGTAVRIFDGRGREYLGLLEIAGRDNVAVRTTKEVVTAREPRVITTLAQALLKNRKLDDVVKDATMLGVRTIRPLVSANTEVAYSAETESEVVPRWERIAVASAKQCGRAVVPNVHPPTSVPECLRNTRDDLRLIFVEPIRANAREGLAMLADRPRPNRATLVVGPEGGWTDDEIKLATGSGCEAVTLGDRTLRADAMPIAALSVLFYLWGDL